MILVYVKLFHVLKFPVLCVFVYLLFFIHELHGIQWLNIVYHVSPLLRISHTINCKNDQMNRSLYVDLYIGIGQLVEN